MKRNIKMLIAMLVVLILFAGGYFLLTKWEPEKEEETPATEQKETEYLIRVEKDDINYVQINNGEITYTIKNAEKPAIEGYFSYVIDDSELSAQISNSCSVDISHKLNSSTEDLSVFGLDNPTGSVLIALKDGTQKKLLIGNASNFDGEYYAMLEGGDFVCTIKEYEVENLMTSPDNFRKPDVCTLDASAVEGIAIEKGGRKEVSVIYDKNFVPQHEYQAVSYLVTYPYNKVTASMDKLDMLFEKLAPIVADRIVEENPKNLSQYGLDKPYVLSITDNEGKTTTLKLGDYGEGASVYLMCNNLPVVYLAKVPFYDFVTEAKADDFVERFINLHNIQTVKEVIFSFGDESHTLGITKKGEDEFTYKIDGKLVSEDPFKKLYQSIIGIIATDFVEENPSGEVKCTITFNLNDGTSNTVTYYNYDERSCIVKGSNGMNCLTLTKNIDNIINSFK